MTLHELRLDRPFALEAGGCIEDLVIAYHTSDRAYKAGDKVVWVCHALTANSDVEDWWAGTVGPGNLIDTEKYYVVCVNMLGSAYGSTGPLSINPADGKPYYLDFPLVTIRDIVNATIEVRKHLGIDRIDLLVGSSIGGFQALEWAVMEPDVMANAVFMATAARASAYMTAYNESQRMALYADKTFEEASSADGGKDGLRCARSIALISYRSFDGYCATQFEADDDCLMATRASSYQQYQGKKLSDRFDAYSYWSLSRTLDTHNIGRGRGGVKAALSTIKARTRVIGIDSDCLFPARVLRSIAADIPGAEYFEIQSTFGHDGFLIEHAQLDELLKPLL